VLVAVGAVVGVKGTSEGVLVFTSVGAGIEVGAHEFSRMMKSMETRMGVFFIIFLPEMTGEQSVAQWVQT